MDQLAHTHILPLPISTGYEPGDATKAFKDLTESMVIYLRK